MDKTLIRQKMKERERIMIFMYGNVKGPMWTRFFFFDVLRRNLMPLDAFAGVRVTCTDDLSENINK